MRNTLKIFLNDLKQIKKSYAAIIVLIALSILPSLYAWFNIEASWDPYSEKATSGIKIGIINSDKGATFYEKEINIGDKVVEKLRDNKKMGWQFVSKEEAEKNLNFGKYYASITIPENFSNDIVSVMSKDVKTPEIIYTVNEKINAVAPKITDKGATGVQENVNKSIVQAISKVVLELSKNVGIEIKKHYPKIEEIHKKLATVQGKFGEINAVFNLAQTTANSLNNTIYNLKKDMPMIEKTLADATAMVSRANDFFTSTKDTSRDISNAFVQNINMLEDLMKSAVNDAKLMINIAKTAPKQFPSAVDNLGIKIDTIKKLNNNLIKSLINLNSIANSKAIDLLMVKLDLRSKHLDNLKNKLGLLKAVGKTSLNLKLNHTEDVLKIFDILMSNMHTTHENIRKNIGSILGDIFDRGTNVSKQTQNILINANSEMANIKTALNNSEVMVKKGQKGLKVAETELPKIENGVSKILKLLDSIDTNKLGEVIDILINDTKAKSDFITNPVNIVEHKLFPMGNYGTGMTPFYSVLSLWVGILLLTSILSFVPKGNYKSTEVYFGKLLLFLLITSLQAFIVSVGDLYLLKIYCKNPFLFICSNVFVSITFTFIVYSLVSVFGNIGKVASIILLVLQVAGSGGTFPIQLTPEFFQRINPFLPFTYAISINREMIGGIVKSVVVRDIFILALFILFSVLIAIFFKKPINKLMEKFIKNFEKSGIGE